MNTNILDGPLRSLNTLETLTKTWTVQEKIEHTSYNQPF